MMKLEVKRYVDENYKNINQFAVALGIGYQAACKIYNGETTKIAFDTLEKMCELFNCTPNDLLISTKQPQKKKNIIRFIIHKIRKIIKIILTLMYLTLIMNSKRQ